MIRYDCEAVRRRPLVVGLLVAAACGSQASTATASRPVIRCVHVRWATLLTSSRLRA